MTFHSVMAASEQVLYALSIYLKARLTLCSLTAGLCDFESGTCGWSSLTSTMTWTSRKGPSSYTTVAGPESDYSLGTPAGVDIERKIP